jgi:hypothetical protein
MTEALPVETVPADDDADLRTSRLRSFTRAMGQRARLGPVEFRRTWQVVAGSILLALGPILILLGYAGAARSPYVEEQIPYLLSGGLLGLGCMVVGGFFFWGHWLYRQYERTEYHQALLLQAVQALQAGNGQTPPTSAESPATDAGVLAVTARGTVAHDPDCTIVAGKTGVRLVSSDEARDSGYSACRICEPPL